MSRERFLLPETASFDFLYDKRTMSNIGELIDEALSQIEDANKAKLEGVFRSIIFNSKTSLRETKERNKRLKNLLEDFKQLDLRPSQLESTDIIGDAYEYLIGNFAADSGKKGVGFYTPPEVSTLLARIIAPKSGDEIADPCCGSGSLLIRTAQEVKDKNVAFYGQEIDTVTLALCRMNMFMHGFCNARIEKRDPIRDPLLIEKDKLKKFNVLVANPPFFFDKWGQDIAKLDSFKRFTYGISPKSRGDYAFILHMISTMTETDGRVGVVVPHGVLFRSGAEGKIRRALIENDLLNGVICLSANLFFETGISAALLFFNRAKSDHSFFFIDGSRDYEEAKKQNRLREEDIDKIVSTWKARKNVDKYAYLATLDEIKDNDFNLNIPLYVAPFEEEEEIDIMEVKKEIEALETELAEVRQQTNNYLKELGFL